MSGVAWLIDVTVGQQSELLQYHDSEVKHPQFMNASSAASAC
jgi:hypothetical protein